MSVLGQGRHRLGQLTRAAAGVGDHLHEFQLLRAVSEASPAGCGIGHLSYVHQQASGADLATADGVAAAFVTAALRRNLIVEVLDRRDPSAWRRFVLPSSAVQQRIGVIVAEVDGMTSRARLPHPLRHPQAQGYP